MTVAYDQAGQRERARNEISGVLKTTTDRDHSLLITILQASPFMAGLQNDPLVGSVLKTLLEKAQKHKEKLPAVRRVLRRHAQSIQMPSARLIVRAFGRPEVVYKERAVNMSDWRTQSVRDLFYYFLYRREAVTKEQISAALWPEISEPYTLKKRFKNEIYRLRRAVGRDVIVFDEEFYLFNRALDYEYDVEAFDTYLKRARKSRLLDEAHPLTQAGQRTIETLWGETRALGTWDFSTNGTYWAGNAGIPSIGFGPGDEKTAHMRHENVPLQEVVDATEFYALLPYFLRKV